MVNIDLRQEIRSVSVNFSSPWVYNMQFRGKDECQEAYLGNFTMGPDFNKEYYLAANEVIIGAYGNSYDDFASVIRSFGFVIGTLGK